MEVFRKHQLLSLRRLWLASAGIVDLFIYFYVCVCFYDLAMPICIILGPLNWTRPDLIHIEGDRDRHHARDPESPAAEEASAQGCSPVPDQRAAAPQPEGVATQGGPPSARVTRAPAKLRTAAGARDDHEPHQLYNYSL
jgi:hypothetical protein